MVALVYLAVACVAFLPGLLSPDDWVGTEARRVQIALEMVRSGEWLVPTLGHEPTLSKPPLHYWVLGGLLHWSSDAVAVLRLPGPVLFLLLACLAHAVVRRSHGGAAAWCAGLGVLLSPLAVVLVPRAEIDPLFSGLTGASLLLLAHGAAFSRRGAIVVGALLGGLAFLAKGPPYLMFFAGTAAVWLRRRRGRGLLLAMAIMAVPPAVYYLLLVGALHGADVLLDAARNESVARVKLFTWSHVLDTPMHFVRAFAATLPFGLFVFFEYRSVAGAGERRAEPDDAEAQVKMAAAPLVSAVLVLALFPARPTRYLLPAIPLFFAAVSPSVAAYARLPSLTPGPRRVVRCLGLLGAVGLCASPWLPAPMGWRTSLGFLALAVLPFVVVDGGRLVVAMLALPVVAVWTFLVPFADHRARDREPFALAGAALRRAVDARGAEDLETLLHVHSAVLLHAGILPRGDEFARREPDARWLLIEEGAVPAQEWLHVATATLPPRDYETRWRLQLPRFTLLLMEHR